MFIDGITSLNQEHSKKKFFTICLLSLKHKRKQNMNSDSNDLTLAIKSMDKEKLIQFALHHKSKKSSFSFKDHLHKLSYEEVDEMLEKLKMITIKCTESIIENEKDNNSNKSEVYIESSQILQGAIDLAQVVLDESLPVLQGLLHIVLFLNSILFDIPSILEGLRNNIAQLCEKMYHLNYIDDNQLYTYNTLIYLLKRTLGNKATKKDVKRIYALRSLIPTVLTMENVNANEVWDLFKKCAASNLYNSMNEGQKIITLTLQLNVVRVFDIHSVIMKKMSSCSKIQAVYYGKAYFEAWSSAVRNNNERLKNELEITCIRDLVLQAIIKRSKLVVDSLRKLLSQFHCQKKEAFVSKMLYNVYQPILLRYLKNPDGLIRAHAAQLFLDVFPLEDPDFDVVTADTELNEQFLMIQDLLVDEFPIVRSTTVSGLYFSMSAHWELFPEDTLKTFFKIIINELSYDSSSVEVRTAVAKGLKILLENPLTIPTLQSILPKLKHLFHDISDIVRIAFCQMLLRVKRICAIKYFDIVPLEDLLARLEEDSVTAKIIVNLIHNSFFPKDTGTGTWLIRCANIVKKNNLASRVLFQYVPLFVQPQIIAKFISQAVNAIHVFVKTTEQKGNKKVCQARYSNRIEQKSATNNDQSDLYSLGLACDFNDPDMVSGFMDGFAIMWLASLNNLKKPENKVELKKLVGKLSKCLSELAMHFKDSPKVFLSIAYLGSFIAPVNIPCLASLCFLKLKNSTETSDPQEYTALLSILCNQSQERSLLLLLKEWITSAFQNPVATPIPLKKKKHKNKTKPVETSEPKHRLAVRMLNFLLEDKLCQKTILDDQIAILSDFLKLFDSLKKRIEELQDIDIEEEEKTFLTELLNILLKISVLIEHENESCKNIQFVDDVVTWIQETLSKLVWPNNRLSQSARKRRKSKSCLSSFENVFIIICKDVCTLLGDVACLGFIDTETLDYAKFSIQLLSSPKGSSLMVNVSKVIYKHIAYGVYLSVVEKNDCVVQFMKECYVKIMSFLNNDAFIGDISPSDSKDIHCIMLQSLLKMSHENVCKEIVPEIVLSFVKNILNNISKDLSNSWIAYEKDMEPFSTIEISKSCAFLLSIVLNRQKISALFLHQLNKYVTNCENDIKSWVVCYLILLKVSETKIASKNLKKEIDFLKTTLGKILYELFPLNQEEVATLAKLENRLCEDDCDKENTETVESKEKSDKLKRTPNKKLSFHMHCHYELKKLKYTLKTKISGTSKLVDD